MRRHKGLTQAMIEALRRVRRGDSLNDSTSPMLITLAALRSRGLLDVRMWVENESIRCEAKITTAGLKMLLATADVKLDEWRGV